MSSLSKDSKYNINITDTQRSFGKVLTVVRIGQISSPMKETFTSMILIVSMKIIVLLLGRDLIRTGRRVPVHECM